MGVQLHDFIDEFPVNEYAKVSPWQLVSILPAVINSVITKLGNDFSIKDGIAIHQSAVVEQGAVLKAPLILFANSFIAAHAYLRGGVLISDSVVIGPGCEIKSSLICKQSRIAHFNFIGDSIIGNYVNIEAGAIITNYHNDKSDKRIFVSANDQRLDTGMDKFGALIGDNAKIGANAVLSPGTILTKNAIVGRLQLVNQQNR